MKATVSTSAMACSMAGRWSSISCKGGEWYVGSARVSDSALIFVRLPRGFTTLGRVDKLPFVYIHELGITMLINVATEGVLLLPVE